MGVADMQTSFDVLDPAVKPTTGAWTSPGLTARLVEMALENRVDILLGRAEVERARAAVRLRQAQAHPDVTPYFGYKRTGAFNTVVGGLAIPIPVRDRNAGAIEESLADVRRKEAALRAVEVRARAQTAAAAEAVQRRAGMLRSVETGMIERARQTTQIMLAAYQEGGRELLDVLDAQRAQNEVGLLYSQVLFDYQASWVDLERAVGTEALPVPGATQQALGASSSEAQRTALD
jgi:cobalt-zinc-cadmium efflux system outer membrane protein